MFRIHKKVSHFHIFSHLPPRDHQAADPGSELETGHDDGSRDPNDDNESYDDGDDSG